MPRIIVSSLVTEGFTNSGEDGSVEGLPHNSREYFSVCKSKVSGLCKSDAGRLSRELCKGLLDFFCDPDLVFEVSLCEACFCFR